MSKPEMKSNRKFTDFVLLPKFGKELKCHKFVLVENSPVFEAMLTQDFEEAITNEMKLDDFDEETVSTFLEYLYTPAKDKAFDSVTAELIRTGPQGNVYKRTFEKERLTPELLKMSFKYQVDDLQKDCIEYLKAHINNDSTALMLLEIASAFEMNDLGEICVKYLEEEINDANVMEILKVAARCDNKAVYSRAKQHLLDRPQGKSLKDVPGFVNDFKNQGKAMLDLLDESVKALSNQRKVKEELRKANQEFKKLHELETELALAHCKTQKLEAQVKKLETQIKHLKKCNKTTTLENTALKYTNDELMKKIRVREGNDIFKSPQKQVGPPAGTVAKCLGSQMTPDMAKLKCKNVLTILLKHSAEKHPKIAKSQCKLTQDLLDSVIEPEEFISKLQQELNYHSPPLCLLPFLKRSVPLLRHSLTLGEVTIDGLKPPNPLPPTSDPPTPNKCPKLNP